MPASEKQIERETEKVTLEEIRSPIQDDLEKVDRLIEENITPDNPVLARAIKENRTTRGKRMRPALLLFAARATGDIKEIHYRVGAIIELIHAATLVHDDVLDEGEFRRQHITLHETFGNELAVLFGDYIFSSAYILTARIEEPKTREILAKAAQSVCKGEVWQTGNKFNYDLDESTYLEIIRLKTASLFSACGKLGAHLNDADPDIEEAFETFGKNFGMAFQIVDDYLDLVGNENTLGKSLGTDLYKGKVTLPIIHLFSRMPEEQKQKALNLLGELSGERLDKDSQPDEKQEEQNRQKLRETFVNWLSEYNLKNDHRQFAGEYLTNARQAISLLNGNPVEENLHKLIDFAERRKR